MDHEMPRHAFSMRVNDIRFPNRDEAAFLLANQAESNVFVIDKFSSMQGEHRLVH